MRCRNHHALLSLAAAGAVAFSALGQTAPAPAESAADEPRPSIWARVLDAGMDAGRWTCDTLSPAAVGSRLDELTADLHARWATLLADADAELSRTLGLFEVTSLDAQGQARWERIAPNRRLPARVILLVHGLDDPGDIWRDAAPALWTGSNASDADGCHFGVLRFDYPNDQAIRHSADLLAAALSDLKRAGVAHVDIVAHSMGGLVARDALTRAEYYACPDARDTYPRVDRLIMLGTPNSGSHLAHFRWVMEIRDCAVRFATAGRDHWSVLLTGLVDGDGQAGQDLLPGSDFLTELNSRPAPAGVRMTLIEGEVSSGLLAWTCQSLDERREGRPLVGRACATAAGWIQGLARFLGDGAVPAWSVGLEGVEDIVTAAADHRSMVTRLPPVEFVYRLVTGEDRQPPAIPIILERLGLLPSPDS